MQPGPRQVPKPALPAMVGALVQLMQAPGAVAGCGFRLRIGTENMEAGWGAGESVRRARLLVQTGIAKLTK